MACNTMTRDDGQRFLTELKVLMAGCVKPEKLSRDRAAAFWRAFKAEPFADFKAACERWARTSKFFPSVAELLSVLPPKPTVIPEPTASAGDRQAMLAKIRELQADLAKKLSMQKPEESCSPLSQPQCGSTARTLATST